MLRHFKRDLAKNTRAGIAFDGSSAGLARVRRLGGGRRSLAIRVVETDESDQVWPDRAASCVADMALQQTPVSTVLSRQAYQLQLVEKPNVPAEELLAAVRWRLKDLIDFSLDEAVVELLEMPRNANAGSASMAYAVVTRHSEVMRQIDVMQRADLKMDVIDIPELCMRNIAILLPEDAYGVAFLHFTEECGYLTITRKGVLYLTRRLKTGRRELTAPADDFTSQERIAGIALEVQRSLDYYESHFDCQPITEIALGPGTDLDALPAALKQHLGLSVNEIKLADLFDLEDGWSTDQQGNCLLAIGAALRSDAPTRAAVSR